jgi:hypothetical protein
MKRYLRGQHGESAPVKPVVKRSLARHPHRAFSCIVYGWLIVAAIGVIITLLPEAPRRFLVSSTNWETDGGFFANCTPAEYQLPGSYFRDEENLFWRSWSPEEQASIGTIRSKPFSSKASAISLPVVGYPNIRTPLGMTYMLRILPRVSESLSDTETLTRRGRS